MMTAVGKIQEANPLQDKHTLQLTVKINSLLVKIRYGTAFFFLYLPQSHTHTENTYTHPSQSTCAHGHHIKALYCIDVVAAESMPIECLHPQRYECTVNF